MNRQSDTGYRFLICTHVVILLLRSNCAFMLCASGLSIQTSAGHDDDRIRTLNWLQPRLSNPNQQEDRNRRETSSSCFYSFRVHITKLKMSPLVECIPPKRPRGMVRFHHLSSPRFSSVSCLLRPVWRCIGPNHVNCTETRHRVVPVYSFDQFEGFFRTALNLLHVLPLFTLLLVVLFNWSGCCKVSLHTVTIVSRQPDFFLLHAICMIAAEGACQYADLPPDHIIAVADLYPIVKS